MDRGAGTMTAVQGLPGAAVGLVVGVLLVALDTPAVLVPLAAAAVAAAVTAALTSQWRPEPEPPGPTLRIELPGSLDLREDAQPRASSARTDAASAP